MFEFQFWHREVLKRDYGIKALLQKLGEKFRLTYEENINNA